MRRAVAAAVALVAVTACGGGDAPLSSTRVRVFPLLK